jgi:hypothetical protein
MYVRSSAVYLVEVYEFKLECSACSDHVATVLYQLMNAVLILNL